MNLFFFVSPGKTLVFQFQIVKRAHVEHISYIFCPKTSVGDAFFRKNAPESRKALGWAKKFFYEKIYFVLKKHEFEDFFLNL